MEDMTDITLCEELSLNAHPALKTLFYDGWILRFANGFTARANSVNIVYPCVEDSARDNRSYITEKINRVEKIYQNENLPSIFKITPLNKDLCNLDALLQERGYKIVTPTNIMCRSLEDCALPISAAVTKDFTPDWEENYVRLKGLKGTKEEAVARKIHAAIQQTVYTAAVTQKEKVVALGMCVIERGWVGLYDIFVDARYRGQGFGFSVCASLLQTASRNGAKNAYLQVVADNAPAVKLYEKLGYKTAYEYWYRVK